MGKLEINGQVIVYDDKYSFKDFTGRLLTDAKDMEGITIYGSCFSHETPDTKVFPQNIKKITFVNCNLDNVFMVKPDWIVVGGTNKRFLVQNDLRDWEIDSTGKPLKVLNEKHWNMQGLSVDPLDIPITKLKDIQKLKRQ